MRLAIGSAQFGMRYGISNLDGRMTEGEVSKILSQCKENKINVIDTAAGYGESETILGECGVSDFKVISKLPPIKNLEIDFQMWSNEVVDNSLKKLKIPCLEGLLIHQPEILFSNKQESILSALNALRDAKKVKKIGVSIYGTDSLAAITKIFDFDIVQAPYNVIDKTLQSSGWLEKLNKLNIEVHVRSIFLQGLLLMPANRRPIFFEKWNDLFRKWDNYLLDNGLTAAQVCLSHVMRQASIAKVIVGVGSSNHLHEIIEAYNAKFHVDEFKCNIQDIDQLIDPRKWNLEN